MGKIKVLIVDDSALVRSILSKGLANDPEIEVIGTAADVYIARDIIVTKNPDVITLDVEMPKMDGVEFLKKLMPQYPVPVVMVSAMTGPKASITIEAMESGAIDYVLKPSSSFGNKLHEMIDELIIKLKVAAKTDVSHWKNMSYNGSTVETKQKVLHGGTDKIIVMGASTGGTVALRKIIEQFPPNMPGTVIVQHMPGGFTKMFAEKLDKVSKVSVKEAETGDRILRGTVLVAPGGETHLEVVRTGGQYRVNCIKGEKVNGHKPSVGVLFNSVAKQVGSNAVGVILTGMGRDGAFALKNMLTNGARTIAQDEKTSVVFGMPMEAWKCGGAEELVPLQNITDRLISILEGMK
ncbi:MAG: chemotaxis response regulator protein-glutamate methylesterase [Spirochaetales bacterium]|nr:chemotaxis response regulator protein-glutamate methylesterase [Spirochaetales bacterium]